MRSCTFFRVTCFPLVWAPCKFTYSGQPIGFEHPQIGPSHRSLSPATPAVGSAPSRLWKLAAGVASHRIPSPNPSDPCRPGYLRSFISEPTKMLWLSAVSQSNLCMQDVCLRVPEKQSRQTSLSLQPQIITVEHKKKRERTETFTLKTNTVQSFWLLFSASFFLTSLPVSCLFGYNPLDPKVCRV